MESFVVESSGLNIRYGTSSLHSSSVEAETITELVRLSPKSVSQWDWNSWRICICNETISANIPTDLSLQWKLILQAAKFCICTWNKLAAACKMVSVCHFSRALPASIWGNCSQDLVLLAFGAHKKGCDNDFFRAVFPRKTQITNRPCLPPQLALALPWALPP